MNGAILNLGLSPGFDHFQEVTKSILTTENVEKLTGKKLTSMQANVVFQHVRNRKFQPPLATRAIFNFAFDARVVNVGVRSPDLARP